MGDQIDACVESFFSKFDNEENEEIDFSAPSAETKEVETKESEVKANPKETKEEAPKEADTDTKDKEDDKLTPFHEHPRWKEKLASERKLKEANDKMSKNFEKMQQEIEALKNKPKTDDEIANMTPQDAAKYAREQAEIEFNKKSELSKKETEDADRYIADALEVIKDSGFDLNNETENEILKYAEQYTEGNIEKAFELYQKFNDTKESGKSEEAKEAAKKKAAQTNRSNRGSSGKVSGFVRGTGWGNLNLK